MSRVDLGFHQTCDPWRLSSYQFPSKIGGKPAWLDLENVPSVEKIQCEKCQEPMTFLCQVYAPIEEDHLNFHRTIFLFICRKAECSETNTSSNIKVFRCSLERSNKFYPFDPPEERENPLFREDNWTKLCVLCGCSSTKHCSKCKNASYCSREHQVLDWKESHKNICGKEEKSSTNSSLLFPEFELVMEEEELSQESVDENEEIAKFKQLEQDGKTGTMRDISDTDLTMHAFNDKDKAFTYFKQRISEEQDQLLRYERGGEPLWIANQPKPEHIPNCEYCGGPRQFEFQIMPQLLTVLKEETLDWGIIIVYSCKQSCDKGDIYKNEFVFKQDISIDNS